MILKRYKDFHVDVLLRTKIAVDAVVESDEYKTVLNEIMGFEERELMPGEHGYIVTSCLCEECGVDNVGIKNNHVWVYTDEEDQIREDEAVEEYFRELLARAGIGEGEKIEGCEQKMKDGLFVGYTSTTGNVYCPICDRWTGKNIHVDEEPYECQHCGRKITLSSDEPKK